MIPLLLLIALLVGWATAQSLLEQAYLQHPSVQWACVQENLRPGIAKGVNTCVLIVYPPEGAFDAERVEFEAYLNYTFYFGREPEGMLKEGMVGPIKAHASLKNGKHVEIFRVLKPYDQALIPIAQKWFNWSVVADPIKTISDAVYTRLSVSTGDVYNSVLFVPLIQAQKEWAYPGGYLGITLWIRICGQQFCTRSYRLRL